MFFLWCLWLRHLSQLETKIRRIHWWIRRILFVIFVLVSRGLTLKKPIATSVITKNKNTALQHRILFYGFLFGLLRVNPTETKPKSTERRKRHLSAVFLFLIVTFITNGFWRINPGETIWTNVTTGLKIQCDSAFLLFFTFWFELCWESQIVSTTVRIFGAFCLWC